MTKYQGTSKYEFRQKLQPKIAPLTAAVGGALAAGSLQAATITVDTLSDSLGDANACSLRAALYASSTNATFDGCQAGEAGEDTIVFDSSLSGTIALQAGTGLNYYDGSTLAVGESAIIDGDGDITIQGTGDAPVLYSKYDSTTAYNAESLAIYGLTITGGGGARGGGVRSRSPRLALTSTTITGNAVTDNGGGVSHEPFNSYGYLDLLASQVTSNSVSGTAGTGGGVAFYSSLDGNVQIAGSTFYGNSVADGDGGGLHVGTTDLTTVELKYNTFEGNIAGGRGGGAALDVGFAVVTVEDNDFLGNASTNAGGGLYLREDNSTYQEAEITLDSNTFIDNQGSSGGGAAISVQYGDMGTIAQPEKFVQLTGENFFDGNTASQSGGGMWLDLGDTVVGRVESAEFSQNLASNAGGGALSAFVNASQITIQNSTFLTNGTNGGSGGAVYAAVTDGAFFASGIFAVSNNSSGAAGGIQVVADNSDFGIEYSEFFSNTASGCGGGVRLTGTPNEAGIGHSILAGNQASCGGAVSLFAPSAGNVLVEMKYNEMSGNNASATGSGTGGGAIFADFGSGSSVFLKNSTISGNSSAGVAGGVRLTGDTSAELKYATIADNYAYDTGGGIYSSLTSCSISNTILGGNTNQTGAYQDLASSGADNCDVSDSLLAGAKYSDYDDGGGNIVNVAPDLQPRADNGGNGGWTHALQVGSPAIDAGSAGSYAPDYDQRGPAFPRVQGGSLDMGAFEVGPAIGEIFSDRFEQP